jgi:hypothetical protein
MDGRTVDKDFVQTFTPIYFDFVLGGDGKPLLSVVGDK